MVSQFVKATGIKRRNIAEGISDTISGLDLESAIALLDQLKNNDEYIEFLKTEDESEENENGTIVLSFLT